MQILTLLSGALMAALHTGVLSRYMFPSRYSRGNGESDEERAAILLKAIENVGGYGRRSDAPDVSLGATQQLGDSRFGIVSEDVVSAVHSQCFAPRDYTSSGGLEYRWRLQRVAYGQYHSEPDLLVYPNVRTAPGCAAVSEEDVVPVTHMTPERLGAVKLLVARWLGPGRAEPHRGCISLALLLCDRSGWDSFVAEYESTPGFASHVSLHVVQGRKTKATYPFNVMRNAALEPWNSLTMGQAAAVRSVQARQRSQGAHVAAMRRLLSGLGESLRVLTVGGRRVPAPPPLSPAYPLEGLEIVGPSSPSELSADGRPTAVAAAQPRTGRRRGRRRGGGGGGGAAPATAKLEPKPVGAAIPADVQALWLQATQGGGGGTAAESAPQDYAVEAEGDVAGDGGGGEPDEAKQQLPGAGIEEKGEDEATKPALQVRRVNSDKGGDDAGGDYSEFDAGAGGEEEEGTEAEGGGDEEEEEESEAEGGAQKPAARKLRHRGRLLLEAGISDLSPSGGPRISLPWLLTMDADAAPSGDEQSVRETLAAALAADRAAAAASTGAREGRDHGSTDPGGLPSSRVLYSILSFEASGAYAGPDAGLAAALTGPVATFDAFLGLSPRANSTVQLHAWLRGAYSGRAVKVFSDFTKGAYRGTMPVRTWLRPDGPYHGPTVPVEYMPKHEPYFLAKVRERGGR